MSDPTRDAFATIGVLTMVCGLAVFVWLLGAFAVWKWKQARAEREAAQKPVEVPEVYMPVRELRTIQAIYQPPCDPSWDDPNVQLLTRNPKWHLIMGGKGEDGGKSA